MMPDLSPFELDEKERKTLKKLLEPHVGKDKIIDKIFSVETHLFTSPKNSKKISFGKSLEIYGTHITVGEYPIGISSTLMDGNKYIIIPGKDKNFTEYIKLFGGRTYSKDVNCETSMKSCIFANVKKTMKKDYPETYCGSDLQIYRIGDSPVNGILIEENEKSEIKKYEFEL